MSNDLFIKPEEITKETYMSIIDAYNKYAAAVKEQHIAFDATVLALQSRVHADQPDTPINPELMTMLRDSRYDAPVVPCSDATDYAQLHLYEGLEHMLKTLGLKATTSACGAYTCSSTTVGNTEIIQLTATGKKKGGK